MDGTLWLDVSGESPTLKRYTVVTNGDGDAVGSWETINDASDLSISLSALAQRMTAAEQRIKADSIVQTVTQSTEYTAAMSTLKQAVSALDGTLSVYGQALSDKVGSADYQQASEEAEARTATIVQTLQSAIEQLSDSVTVRFTQSADAQSTLEAGQAALKAAQDTLALYIRFSASGMEIGRTDDPVKLYADNARLYARNLATQKVEIGPWAILSGASGLAVKYT